MKKLIYLLFACAALSAQAQHRCGTMEYAAHRQAQDPAYNARMNDMEKIVQQWIKEHPETEAKKFPTIDGFQPTGNIETDNRNYAIAKQRLSAGKAPDAKKSIDPATDKLLRERKRNANSFIEITNN